MPAYNAAETLDEAVSSVVAQGRFGWELLIVDDGSTDDTPALARRWAGRDRRIRLLQQDNAGVSSARNRGLREATGDWVTFLDSDDWLAPGFLAAMHRAARRSRADAVLCAAVDILPDGRAGKRYPPPPHDQLFPVASQRAPVAVHAALVRRDLVRRLGGWDEGLATCEDWDLWQRLARSTARISIVRKTLARIRLRPGSLSRSAAEVLASDGIEVILRGHRADPRVCDAAPRWACGCPPEQMPEALAEFVAWAAAIDVATGGSGDKVLDRLPAMATPALAPDRLAGLLQQGFYNVALGEPAGACGFLSGVQPILDRFETLGGTEALARRTLHHLELRLLQHAAVRDPLLAGRTFWLDVDLGAPVPDIRPPADAQFVAASLTYRGRGVGTLTLPAQSLANASDRVARAIADRRGARIVATELATGDWRGRLHVLRALARAAADRRTVRFALSAAQLPPAAAKQRLRAFALRIGREVALTSGLLRARHAQPGEGLLPMARRRRPAATRAARDTDKTADHWERVFAAPDPWDYDSAYEQTKYRQTLDLLLPGRIDRALELACAEGHFTRLLAPRVGQLVASDISSTAVARAAQACAGHDNVEFRTFDLYDADPPGTFDLIVCSEVLYYVESRRALRRQARRLRAHLNPGGHILMAHATIAANAPGATGFDWGHLFDARSIGDIFAATPGLRLIHEARSDLYRLQLFRAVAAKGRTRAAPARIDRVEHSPRTSLRITSQVQWNGCAAHRDAEFTDRLPILMYHRVAPEGPAPLDEFRVTPEQFALQMQHLAEHGYYAVSLDEWGRACADARGLRGRAVAITFDDGYLDFHRHALPVLQQHGFRATVFVVPDRVGGRADWDAAKGEPAPLMDWAHLREAVREGIHIGSHTLDHPYLTAISPAEVADQVGRSRAILQQKLGVPVTSFAYPYGDLSDPVEELVAESGYGAGVTTSGLPSGLSDRPLRLGRLAVTGGHDLAGFRQLLPPTVRGTGLRHARMTLRTGARNLRRRLS